MIIIKNIIILIKIFQNYVGVYNINTSILFSWAYIYYLKKFNNDNIIIKELFDWAYKKKNTNSSSDIFF